MLNLYSTEDMPIYNIAGAAPCQFALVARGEIAEEFDGWFQKAKVIHAWNNLTEEILNNIMASCTSWGQIRKAFPEMYDLLADTSPADPESWKYGASDKRISALLKYFRNRGHAGAHDKISDYLKKAIRRRKGPIIEVMKQALSLSSETALSGVLDVGPFRLTWLTKP